MTLAYEGAFGVYGLILASTENIIFVCGFSSAWNFRISTHFIIIPFKNIILKATDQRHDTTHTHKPSKCAPFIFGYLLLLFPTSAGVSHQITLTCIPARLADDDFKNGKYENFYPLPVHFQLAKVPYFTHSEIRCALQIVPKAFVVIVFESDFFGGSRARK